MAGFARKKRVADPFDDEARARHVGANHWQLSFASSGSEHSGHGDDDSPCLSELVLAFLENDGNGSDSVGDDLDSERVDSVADLSESVEDMLRLNVALHNVDPHRNLLLAHVSEAVEKLPFLIRAGDVSDFRRNVVAFLWEKGHNAAICKTQWDSAGGVTAGSHEFIDVVQSGSSVRRNRYFVDLDFRAQFEIARPTRPYSEILRSVPGVFVGGEEELKRTVRAMCDVAKQCFRSRGFSVPPWRKNQFMQNKWFAPCRQIMNPVKGSPVPAVTGCNCRLVGFDHVVSAARRGGGGVRTR